MQPHVILQSACPVECSVTYLTGEGLLPCVDANVLCQSALITTTVFTVLAFVDAFLTVYSTLVICEDILPAKRLVTLIT